jgi:hypothetical protein
LAAGFHAHVAWYQVFTSIFSHFLGATTFSITTLNITINNATLCITTLYITALSIITFCITTLSIITLNTTINGKESTINTKQSTRWQHLSRLKASAFFSLQKKFSCYETQQLILGTGTAIWWVTEPHYVVLCITTLSITVLDTALLNVVNAKCPK